MHASAQSGRLGPVRGHLRRPTTTHVKWDWIRTQGRWTDEGDLKFVTRFPVAAAAAPPPKGTEAMPMGNGERRIIYRGRRRRRQRDEETNERERREEDQKKSVETRHKRNLACKKGEWQVAESRN